MTLRHAFVDESIRNDGWYRLTVATIAARDVNAVVRDLRSLRPEGRQRLHFSSEGDAVRHRILDGILRLPVSATTFAAPCRRAVTTTSPVDGASRRWSVTLLPR